MGAILYRFVGSNSGWQDVRKDLLPLENRGLVDKWMLMDFFPRKVLISEVEDIESHGVMF